MADDGFAVPRSAGLIRRLPLLAVWSLAAVPAVLFAVHAGDPIAAVRAANAIAECVRIAGLVFAVLAVGAAVCSPVLRAWLRLRLHDLRQTWGVDRRALLHAQAALRLGETAHRHLEVGRLALARGELELAGAHLHRAVQLDDTLVAAHFCLGRALLKAGALPAAYRAFLHAERLDPGHNFGDALLLAARCADLLGQRDAALALFEQFDARHGGGSKAHFWRAEALAHAGRDEAALAAWRAAAAPAPSRATPEDDWFRARARARLRSRGALS